MTTGTRKSTPALLAALLFGALLGVPVVAHPLRTVGWVEPVSIAGGKLVLEAKLDTGADVSSLDARDMRSFRRDGREWVSFAVFDGEGRRVHFERPVERKRKIKNAANDTQKRPVVLLEICLGGVQKMTPVNLVDRANMSTPMLIGRSFLEGSFAVDSALTRTTKADCSLATEKKRE